MFFTLLKARIAALLNGIIMSGRKQKTQTTALLIFVIVLLLFSAFSIFSLMFVVFWGLGTVCKDSGFEWLYFAFGALIAFALSVFSGIFASQTQLYNSKDNELLLSMPIPPMMILWTRVAVMFVINVFLCSLVLVPAIIMYAVVFGFTAVGFISAFLSLILLPMLIFAVVALLGWIVKLLAMKIKFKNLLAVLAFIVGFTLYFYFISNADKFINGFAVSIDSTAASIINFFPLYHFGLATTGNIVSLLIFILCCVIPFTLIFTVLSKTYFTLITAKVSSSKATYVAGKEKEKNFRKALIFKELKRLGSSVPYMLNACTGAFICIIAVFLMLIYRSTILEYSDVIVEYNIYLYGVFALCGLASMNFITSPSISLEGKNLWIAKSLPIDPFEIIMAKVYMAMIVTAPPLLIFSIVSCFVITIPIEGLIPFILFPQIANFLFELIGVMMNLKFPKLNHINDTQAIKQSLALFLSMIISWAITGSLSFFAYALSLLVPASIVLLIITFITVGLCAAAIYIIKTIGVKLFAGLS